MATKRAAAIVGMVVAVAGVAAPILWDVRKSARSLEIQVLGTSSFNKATQPFSELEIVYKGKSIQELSRLELAMANTGRSAFLAADCVTCPSIRFPSSVNVLSYEVLDVTPENLQVELRHDAAKNAIEIVFPLLNPHNYARFAIVCEGPEPAWEIDGRIVNLGHIHRFDRRAELAKNPAKHSWTLYVVGLITAFCSLCMAFSFVSIKRVRLARKRHQLGTLVPAADRSVAEYEALLKNELSYLDKVGVAELRKAVDGLKPGDVLGERRVAVVAALEKQFSKLWEDYCALSFFFLVVLCGMFYILLKTGYLGAS